MTPVGPGGEIGETTGVEVVIVVPLESVVVYTVKLVDSNGGYVTPDVEELVIVEPLESVVITT